MSFTKEEIRQAFQKLKASVIPKAHCPACGKDYYVKGGQCNLPECAYCGSQLEQPEKPNDTRPA